MANVITQFLQDIDNVANELLVSYLQEGISTVTPVVSALVVTVLAFWFYTRVIAFMAGTQNEAFLPILYSFLIKVIILTIASTTSFFIYYISSTLWDLMDSITKVVSESNGPFSSFSKTTFDYAEIAGKEYEKYEWYDFGPIIIWVIKCGLFYTASMLLHFAVIRCILMNKIIFVSCITVGPLFTMMAAFQPTKGMFSGWLNATLTYGFSVIFISLVVSLASDLGLALIQRNGESLDITFINTVMLAVIFYYISKMVYKMGDVAGQFFGSGNITDRVMEKMAYDRNNRQRRNHEKKMERKTRKETALKQSYLKRG